MPKRCIYCRSELSKENKSFEHAIPRWLLDELGAKKAVIGARGVSSRGEVTPDRQMVANRVGRTICQRCNNGWLSEIDSSCQDFAKHICLLPDSKWDGQEEAELLKFRTFLYKVAITHLATSPFSEKNRELIENFYKERKTPARTILFLSNYMGPGAVDLGYSNDWLYIYKSEEFAAKYPACSNMRRGSFKFFIKLGYAAFVLANSTSFPMAFDPCVLQATLLEEKLVVIGGMELTPPKKTDAGDSPAMRVLQSLAYCDTSDPRCVKLSSLAPSPAGTADS